MTHLDDITIGILEKMKLVDLRDITEQLDIKVKSNVKKSELINCIDDYLDRESSQLATGTLDILADGYGFLRETSIEKDIYVSSSQIKKFKLRKGDFLFVETKAIINDKNGSLKRLLRVNGESPSKSEQRVPFENLVPSYPHKQIKLETTDSVSGRIIDLIAPIGRGQRALIIAPPKAGKTTLIIEMANSILKNEKNCEVWILLVDERPEEVTDIKLNVHGAKVIASTFDMDPSNHIKVTEEVMDDAKKAVEDGKNIIILMDSLTRLSRAYNIVLPSSGKLLSGGIDPTALHAPKKFFGTARNIQDGGSLTIIASVLVDTGSKMDDIIFEEFKSTGNCDIYLDKALAEMRIFPTIDVQRSGTRKEELLLDSTILNMIWELRRYIKDFDKATSASKIIEAIKNTKNNREILDKYIEKNKKEKKI